MNGLIENSSSLYVKLSDERFENFDIYSYSQVKSFCTMKYGNFEKTMYHSETNEDVQIIYKTAINLLESSMTECSGRAFEINQLICECWEALKEERNLAISFDESKKKFVQRERKLLELRKSIQSEITHVDSAYLEIIEWSKLKNIFEAQLDEYPVGAMRFSILNKQFKIIANRSKDFPIAIGLVTCFYANHKSVLHAHEDYFIELMEMTKILKEVNDYGLKQFDHQLKNNKNN